MGCGRRATFALVDCNGTPIPSGSAVASCQNLEDAVIAGGGQLLEDCAGVLLPPGSQVASCADLNAAVGAVVPGQALQDCLGALLPDGAQVPTCAQMNAAIGAVTPGQALTDCLGALLPDGAQVPTCAQMNAAIAAAIPPPYVLNDCLGAPIPSGAQIPTCAQMNAAIAASGGQALEDCAGVLLPVGAQVVPCSQFNAPQLVTGDWQFTAGRGVTAPFGDNDDTLATTAFVQQAVSGTAPPLSDCAGNPLALNEQVVTCLQLTIPTVVQNWQTPTPPLVSNDDSLATTAFVQSLVTGAGGQALTDCLGALLPNGTQMVTCAQLVQPTVIQNWVTPTPPFGDNDTSIATTAFVQQAIAGASFLTLLDCDGVNIPAGTQVPTCAQAEARYLRLDGSNDPITGPIDFNDQPLIDPFIGPYTEPSNTNGGASGVVNVNAGLSDNHTLVLVGNIIITLSGAPVAGRIANLTIFLTQDALGGRTVTWPGSVRWAGGAAHVMTATALRTDVVTLCTKDAGATWFGFVSGQDFAP